MMSNLFILLLCLNPSLKTLPTVLHFRHVANGQLLERNKPFQLSEERTFSIKQWKYYISHIELLQKKGKAISIPGIFLIDAFGKDSISLPLQKGNYAGIKFSIGIDSSIHLGGAQDGDLDPLNGMYWAWNTGYIHYKLEGEEATAGHTTKRFQYHVGGFSGINNTMQTVKIAFRQSIQLNKKSTELPIVAVDIVSFLNSETVKNEKPLVMKEGKDAVEISKVFPTLYSFKEHLSANER